MSGLSPLAWVLLGLMGLSGAALAAVAWDVRRLPGRLLVLGIEQFLRGVASAAQDLEGPLP